MISRHLLSLWRHASKPIPAKSGAEPFFYRAWKWSWQQYSRFGWQSDLFERIADTDWDVLIILDACRYDVLSSIAAEVVVECARSPVSATPAFLDRARQSGVFEKTTYISANPQTEERKPGDDVTLIQLYQDRWDPVLLTISPETVYEEVRAHLEGDRPIVAHTIQPHYPHISEIAGEIVPVPNGLHGSYLSSDLKGKKLQYLLTSGEVSLQRARESYRSCARFAWDKAREFAGELVAQDQTVVITADHGELFGEWGFVGHPSNVNLEQLVAVPWVVFRPTDAPNAEHSVETQLTALGYTT